MEERFQIKGGNWSLYEVWPAKYPTPYEGMLFRRGEELVNLVSITGDGTIRWIVRGDFPGADDKAAIEHFGLEWVCRISWMLPK